MQFGEWRSSGGIAVTIYNTLRVHKWEAEKLRIMEQVHGNRFVLLWDKRNYPNKIKRGRGTKNILDFLFNILDLFGS